jgi:hypothetical protein
MVGRGQVSVPFHLSALREIKKDMGSYTDAPDHYIQAFISVIQTFKLAQATQVGNDNHLQ